jgi:hypothetical protein
LKVLVLPELRHILKQHLRRCLQEQDFHSRLQLWSNANNRGAVSYWLFYAYEPLANFGMRLNGSPCLAIF